MGQAAMMIKWQASPSHDSGNQTTCMGANLVDLCHPHCLRSLSRKEVCKLGAVGLKFGVCGGLHGGQGD